MTAATILIPLIALCLLAGYISFIVVIGSTLGPPKSGAIEE